MPRHYRYPSWFFCVAREQETVDGLQHLYYYPFKTVFPILQSTDGLPPLRLSSVRLVNEVPHAASLKAPISGRQAVNSSHLIWGAPARRF